MKYKGIEYKKDFSMLKDSVVSVLADGEFPTNDKERWHKYLEDTYGGDRVLAVIAFPFIDIELEAYSRITDKNGKEYLDEPNTATDNNKIDLTYAVCIRGLWKNDYLWEIHGDADECKVDFSASNWSELLEKEMCERLEEYANKHGLSFTEPNFD